MSQDDVTKPPAGKMGRREWVILAAVVVGALVFGAIYSRQSSQSSRDGLTLTVGGSASSISLSVTTSSGTSTYSVVSGTTKNYSPGSLYVQVQNTADDGGSVSCQLARSDGTVVASNVAVGTFAAASCSGS